MYHGLKWCRQVATIAAIVSCTTQVKGQTEPAAMQSLSVTCSFDTPRCDPETNGYSRITVRGCVVYQGRGRPQMPFRTVRLLLPPSSRIAGIAFRPQERPLDVDGNVKVAFGREPLPTESRTSAMGTGDDVPDPSVYNATNAYPARQVELASVHRMAGHDIAVLRVFPLQYLPAAGRLVFTPVMTVGVTVSTATGASTSASMVRPPSCLTLDRLRIASSVDNPDLLRQYIANPPADVVATKTLNDAPTYDYLLVTRSSLRTSFDPLVTFHTNRGLSVKTETMESITNLYTGRDSAEKLRNYIRHAYTNWGIRYVLLGGDVDAVPTRGVYARCSGQTLTSMPSDLYFACLDGSWDGNNNGIWAEPADGDSGGDVDLLAEVLVGRAPVDTPAEVDNFVAKTLAAASNAQSRFRVCMAGEYLGYVGGAHAQGGDALDTLMPPVDNSLSIATWLDDRPNHGSAWTTADAIRALNNAPMLVAHYGHADESTVMRMDVSDIASLGNALPFLLYSTGCDAGAFDNFAMAPDCIGEELVKGTRHGAFATVVNTRSGWFDGQHEWLYSGEYQQRFFDGILTDGRARLGEVHQWAKQDMIGTVETSGNMPYRWCYFGITLLGDPCVALEVPLSLCIQLPHTPSTTAIRWNSRTNALYSVFRTSDLVGQIPVCVKSNIVATPPLNTYTDAVSGVNQAFYRVEAQ